MSRIFKYLLSKNECKITSAKKSGGIKPAVSRKDIVQDKFSSNRAEEQMYECPILSSCLNQGEPILK